jgi:branched-chain amino acid transport system permease protein
VTIAFFYILQLLAYNLRFLTNGSTGISLPIPPWDGDFYNEPFYYSALVLLLLAIIVTWWIRHSKYGLCLLAIRDDEDRACGLGVNTDAYKLWALVLSAWFVGVGGGIWAYFVGALYPPFAFDPTVSTAFALMSFLGGIGTLSGPLIGALIFTPVQQYLTLQFGENGLSLLIEGALFLCILWQLPRGIIPTLRQRSHQQKERKTS